MSTKNLSRTIIEGGRCGHYKSEVHACARSERSELRTHLRSLALDPELEEDLTHPKRQPVSPCFSDKLRPIYRFLDSKIGKNWDGVRSELFQKFDTRTTPGRHVLFDHLLRDVDEGKSGELLWYPRRYVVDAEGVLRKDESRRYLRGAPRKAPDLDTWMRTATWLAGRKIGKAGSRFAWYVATKDPHLVGTIYQRFEIEYVYLLQSGGVRYHEPSVFLKYPTPRMPMLVLYQPFRQSGLLGADDDSRFRKLPAAVQEKILAKAPVNMR